MDDNTKALKALRDRFTISQREFAQWMGVPLRTYEDLESGRTPIREIHVRAAQMAALLIAEEKDEATKLPQDLQDIVAKLHQEILFNA